MSDDIAALAGVALGGGIGALLRFAISGVVGRAFGETFPWGTMAVNVSGAFAIGLISAIFAQSAPSLPWFFAVTGILGSYTTVSSFSLQTLLLARDRQIGLAAANAALSLALCLGAVAAGFSLARGPLHG